MSESKHTPVARVAEVHMSRYTIEWTDGPLAEGTDLYGPDLAAEVEALRASERRAYAALDKACGDVIDLRRKVEALEGARIALVTALDSLASNFENRLYKLNDDAEALKKARGDIEHAREAARPFRYNGTDAALAASQKGGV